MGIGKKRTIYNFAMKGGDEHFIFAMSDEEWNEYRNRLNNDMSSTHRTRLADYHKTLVHNTNITKALDNMRVDDVLDSEDIEVIQQKGSINEQVRHLLISILPRKGEKGYYSFARSIYQQMPNESKPDAFPEPAVRTSASASEDLFQLVDSPTQIEATEHLEPLLILDTGNEIQSNTSLVKYPGEESMQEWPRSRAETPGAGMWNAYPPRERPVSHAASSPLILGTAIPACADSLLGLDMVQSQDGMNQYCDQKKVSTEEKVAFNTYKNIEDETCKKEFQWPEETSPKSAVSQNPGPKWDFNDIQPNHSQNVKRQTITSGITHQNTQENGLGNVEVNVNPFARKWKSVGNLPMAMSAAPEVTDRSSEYWGQKDSNEVKIQITSGGSQVCITINNQPGNMWTTSIDSGIGNTNNAMTTPRIVMQTTV